ncbi:motile sperm domain-containing protein 1-like [Dendronephthya gigantea]|uniref:motile sperm domain-containing protein 1-like n=1 Tax=Dendronephthya gigantea TaxID=151771 RepID=UPI00106B6CE7|nr:motile sperm domain-containing protein 1-like [Dendronephthya gigantea]XP_028401413.1 motile sperm domain-containing protein 1-like [Dendronephthya gigantea]
MKSQQNLKDGSLPVFVFPESLTFIADDQTTFKQILTVYNPYKFSVQFKVFGTAPRCYKVTEAEGIIKPRCYVDVVIRCVEISNLTERTDKFRLCLFEYGVRKHIGEKEITALVLKTRSNAEKQSKSKITEKSFRRQHLKVLTEDVKSGPGVMVISLCCVCLIALMLPTVGETTSIPPYLHLTVNQKLIAAYILGLATMAILKTS